MFSFTYLLIFIHLRDREKKLPSVDSLYKYPQELGLGQAEAGNSTQVSHSSGWQRPNYLSHLPAVKIFRKLESGVQLGDAGTSNMRLGLPKQYFNHWAKRPPQCVHFYERDGIVRYFLAFCIYLSHQV